MAKTQTPFFSFGAHGSVGEAITAQKRGQETLLREKPLPTDPYSLPQAYQRWLYEDYAYRWRQQSAATQAQYRSAGVRYHLTGFQYWMKYQLAGLPNISGYWKLDATGVDSSRNFNNGTVFGATPCDGLIGRALSFDGINDYVNIPDAPSLDTPYTFETWVNPVIEVIHATAGHILLSKHLVSTCGLYILYNISPNRFFLCYEDSLGAISFVIWNIPTHDVFYHLVGIFNSANRAELFVNGASIGTGAIIADMNDPAMLTAPVLIGGGLANRYLQAIIDNAIIYNRALDPTEILRHSERRYPAQ